MITEACHGHDFFPLDMNGVPRPKRVASPILLVLIAATHLAYTPLTGMRDLPWLPAAFALSSILGLGYVVAAWLSRRGRGFGFAVDLFIGEDLGVLGAGLLLGFPWGDYLRPGSVVILVLQLGFAITEILWRQERGERIAPGSRLAWFVIANALAFALYFFLEPPGLIPGATIVGG